MRIGPRLSSPIEFCAYVSASILGNALQHGAEDFAVTLLIRGEPANVFIAVHNQGTPIPPAELSKIFDPLVRDTGAGRFKKRRLNSIGMGLYIAREVAKAHGGEITFSSNLEEGATFTIRLPR
jgi:signal transduction histidine kinase